MSFGALRVVARMTAQMIDEETFSELAERHRRELHVHCYRMLGSFHEAEELVQDTFLRAWRARAAAAGPDTFRAWLYRIATNVCLDRLRADARRVVTRPGDSPAEVPWLEPYPDTLLAAAEEGPHALAVAKETIELTFLVAVQHLPPRQRAALLLRDVLGWSAKETAEVLATSVAATNSALQRARATLEQHLPAERSEWAPGTDASAAERALLEQLIEAFEAGDPARMEALAHEDLRVTMPPSAQVFEGLAAMAPLYQQAFRSGMGEWRRVATRVNRMPALVGYLRAPGDSHFRPFMLDVIRVVDGRVAEYTTFAPRAFAALGLPATL